MDGYEHSFPRRLSGDVKIGIRGGGVEMTVSRNYAAQSKDQRDHIEEVNTVNITKNTNGTNLNIVLEGRLDTTTAPELEQALKYDMDAANELTLDFSKLDYISSAGLRVLLSAHKAMSKKGGMKVVNANEMVKEVFDVTGFADILTIV